MLQTDAISANDYVQEALRLMCVSDIEQLQVVEGDQLIGIIYRQDIERLRPHVLREADVRDHCRKQ